MTFYAVKSKAFETIYSFFKIRVCNDHIYSATKQCFAFWASEFVKLTKLQAVNKMALIESIIVVAILYIVGD